MKQNEKARKMMNGRFIFPSTWVELNPEKAEASTKVVFLVEDGKCGVYYSVTEAFMLSEAEEKEVRKSGRNMGFSNRANIFGFAENVKNVGNARFIKMEE